MHKSRFAGVREHKHGASSGMNLNGVSFSLAMIIMG